ncbi:MAG: deoxyribodipyrimidine photolyase [Planctomycetes bacterium]|nr:deoxyribodipyrimidine photolyase [Planctomycetota bacterium]
MNGVPADRIQQGNDRPLRRDGEFVLYWMVAARRRRANFGLQRAVELARELDRPLVVLEALRCDYRWASDRLHAFVLQGMRDHVADFADSGALYWPYVEPEPRAGRGLLQALGERACAVVTDRFPTFFLPRMIAVAAARLPVRLELVDSNGLLPLQAAERPFARAVDFRRWLQKHLAPHLQRFPVGDPLRAKLPAAPSMPAAIARRWPAATAALLEGTATALRALPIDHAVPPAPFEGGRVAAGATLRTFLAGRLARYGEERSDPDADAASGLSPYLHFGHLGAHQVFAALAKAQDWSPLRLRPGSSGQRGWFGMDAAAESFADEFITWRELGYAVAAQDPAHDRYDGLPTWAQTTLAAHAGDGREHLYDHEQLESASTHDPVWNAAQNELRRTGRMHNYLRMLWGKKVLEWSPTPPHAFARLLELNNRYALDGRNPNSYTGISWVFGRYDRPWAPERPIFGVIRYMSSTNTVKKLRMKEYLTRWSS